MRLVKGKSFREKAEYFWTYYKTPVLAALALLLTAAFWLHSAASEKETALNVLLMDAMSGTDDETMGEELKKGIGVADGEKEVLIGSSYLLSGTDSGTYAMTSISKFYSEVGTGKLDVCGFWEKDFEKYAGSGSFLDLRNCFSQEELKELEAFLYYEKGAPVGIYAHGLPKLTGYGCYEGHPAIVGIVYNSERVGTAAKALRFLLEK